MEGLATGLATDFLLLRNSSRRRLQGLVRQRRRGLPVHHIGLSKAFTKLYYPTGRIIEACGHLFSSIPDSIQAGDGEECVRR